MKKLILVLLLIFPTSENSVYAHHKNGHTNQGGGNGTGDDPDVPIDGGLGILLIAGASFATKKLLKKPTN